MYGVADVLVVFPQRGPGRPAELALFASVAGVLVAVAAELVAARRRFRASGRGGARMSKLDFQEMVNVIPTVFQKCTLERFVDQFWQFEVLSLFVDVLLALAWPVKCAAVCVDMARVLQTRTSSCSHIFNGVSDMCQKHN